MTYDPHKTTTEVRQGNRKMLNFRALIIGLVLVVVIFGGLFLFYASQTPPTAL